MYNYSYSPGDYLRMYPPGDCLRMYPPGDSLRLFAARILLPRRHDPNGNPIAETAGIDIGHHHHVHLLRLVCQVH